MFLVRSSYTVVTLMHVVLNVLSLQESINALSLALMSFVNGFVSVDVFVYFSALFVAVYDFVTDDANIGEIFNKKLIALEDKNMNMIYDFPTLENWSVCLSALANI